MADILGGFGGSFGGVQGLATEVPLDSFYKGVEMRHYEDAKKLKKKAEEKAYLDEANKLVSIDNPNLHLSYVPEYQKKLKPLVDELLIRSKDEQVDAPYLMQLKSNVSNIQNELEPASKIANNMRQLDPKLMSKSAREAIAMFNSGKEINEINKEVSKYKGTPYDLLDENGRIDLSRQIVTDQDAYGSMGKLNTTVLPFNIVEKVDANGNKRITTYDRPAHTKAEKEAVLLRDGIPKEQWGNYSSTEEILEVGLKNEQTRKNIRLTNGEEIEKRKKQDLENQAKEMALGNKQGITESDPRFADVLFNAQKIVENDAQKVYDAETKAMKDLGMEVIQLKSGYKMDNVAKQRDINIVNNNGNDYAKPKESNYYTNSVNEWKDIKTMSPTQYQTDFGSKKGDRNVINLYAKKLGLPSGDWGKVAGNKEIIFDLPIGAEKSEKSKHNMSVNSFNLVGDPYIKNKKLIPVIVTTADAKGNKVETQLKTSDEMLGWLRQKYPNIPVVLVGERVKVMGEDGYGVSIDEVVEDPNKFRTATPILRRHYKIDTTSLKDLSPIDKEDLLAIVSNLNKFNIETIDSYDNADMSEYDKQVSTKESYNLRNTQKMSTGGKSATTSTQNTPSKPEVKTSEGGVKYKVIK